LIAGSFFSKVRDIPAFTAALKRKHAARKKRKIRNKVILNAFRSKN
jgi:hypothetical protein